MALIVDQQSQQSFYLKAHTTLGRLNTSVDIVADKPEVSKIHALIEWHDSQWTVKDLSSNGTWLNQQKIPRNSPKPISAGDSISLAGVEGFILSIKDVSPPRDMLLPVQDNPNPPIPLAQYNLLPDEQSPLASLAYNPVLDSWELEFINHAHGDKVTLQDGQQITLAGQQWRLQTNAQVAATAHIAASSHTVANTQFHFDVSQDEETTRLKLISGDNQTDLKARSHHYLALLLARKRHHDAQQGLNATTQGWVYTEDMARDLGIEVTHVNILIHRLRKQVSDSLPQIVDLQNLIEREGGKLRLGSSHIHIIKGGEVEA